MLRWPGDVSPISTVWIVVRTVGVVYLPMVQIPLYILILSTDGYSVYVALGGMGTSRGFAIRTMNAHSHDIAGFTVSPFILNADLSATVWVRRKSSLRGCLTW
jgi:hypothetical protein